MSDFALPQTAPRVCLASLTVTLYRNATDIIGTPESLLKCLERVRDDHDLMQSVSELRKLYSLAEDLRRVKDQDRKAKAAFSQAKSNYEKGKRNLPCATFSGRFWKRGNAGLEEYTGIIQVDLDQLKAKGIDKGDLINRLKIDPHVVFAFESPSGDGLKCFIRVEAIAAEHADAFLAMQRYFRDNYGIEPDGACKDVSRLCFLSSDRHILINEHHVIFDWREWSEPEMRESNDENEENSVDLPLDAFPHVIQQLATSCAEVYLVDAALPAVAAITTMAAALGSRVNCTGAVNGRVTPCNLMNIIVAPSGYGKGVVGVVAKPLIDSSAEMAQCFEEIERPQLRADMAIAEARKKEIVGTLKGDKLTNAGREEARTELARLEADIERWTLEASQVPTFYTGSATGAAMGVALKRNDEQLLSLALEAGDAIRVAAGRFTSDNKADYDLLLSGYTGEPFAESRITRSSVRLNAPCLSVLWAVQPTLCMELYANVEAQERGLLARMNAIRCDDDVIPFDDGVRREVSPVLEAEWDTLVRAALNLRRTSRKVTFRAETDAVEVFRNFHNETVALRNGDGRESGAKLMRCRENAIRIAVVIAATEWLANGAESDTPTLTAEHAARGVTIAEFFLAQTLNLTRGAALEKRQARLAEVMSLVLQAGGGITLRLLRDHHGVGENEVHQIVARNPEKLKIETRSPGTKGGRPSARLVTINNANPPKS